MLRHHKLKDGQIKRQYQEILEQSQLAGKQIVKCESTVRI